VCDADGVGVMLMVVVVHWQRHLLALGRVALPVDDTDV
jgi:hypothetical protein